MKLKGGAGANAVIKPKRKTLKKKKKLIIMNSDNGENKAKIGTQKPVAPYNKAFIAILEQLNKIMLDKGEDAARVSKINTVYHT